MYGIYPYGVSPYGAAPAYVAPSAPTMARIAILSPTDSDLATIAAGSQVSTLPVANLQSQQPKKVWRSGSTADYLNVSFAAPIAANMLALVGHNLSAAGLVCAHEGRGRLPRSTGTLRRLGRWLIRAPAKG